MRAQRVGTGGRGRAARRGLRLAALLFGGLLLFFFASLPAQVLGQESAEELYQAGLYQEEVQGNLQSAIELYERILASFPSNRPMAANALMHIGLCHEKRGSQEAQRAYQRLLRDYADQISVAERARVRLASLQGLARPESPAGADSERGIVVRHLFGGDYGDDLDTTGQPSPDGRYLVGVAWGPAASNVAVRDLRTGELRQLTDHPNYGEGMALGASLSPDGNTIAYWWISADEESAEVRLAFMRWNPSTDTLCPTGIFLHAGLLAERRRKPGCLQRRPGRSGRMGLGITGGWGIQGLPCGLGGRATAGETVNFAG